MSRVISSLLLLACTLFCVNSANAIADDKIDLSGGWNFEVDIAGNAGAPVFIFKQDGEKLTGTYKGQFGEAKVAGTVKGSAVEFSFDAQGAKVVYKGTAKKGTMAGEADYAGQASGTWKAAKIDVTGVWSVEIDLGGNMGTPEFNLKQDGEKLTGQYKGQFGEADVTGKVEGDKIEFSFERDGNKVLYKRTISKETMKGDADYAGQASGTWTGKRKVEAK